MTVGCGCLWLSAAVCGCLWLSTTFVKGARVSVVVVHSQLARGSRMDGTPRKGSGPESTLSSSNQLIIQTRRAVFAIFLLLDAAALSFAAAVFHLRYTPAPLYSPDHVVASALLPVITTTVDGLWVAALWLLDLYYPVTFLSKPVGELASFVILIVLHLTTALYLYVDLDHTPFSVEPKDIFFQQRNFSITALMLVLFLLLQSVALTCSLFVVLYSTARYLRAGRWDALDHPICRYDPKTVPLHRHPLELLQYNPSTLHMLSSTNLQSRNTSREPSHDMGSEPVSNYHPRGSRNAGGESTTRPQGRPGWGAPVERPIPVRNFV